MFPELVATFVAGLGAAGVVLAFNRITGGLLPGWTMPLAAGAAMLGVAIWSEMTWARTHRRHTARRRRTGRDRIRYDTAWWRPWTLVWPQTVRLIAFDTGSVRTKDASPDTRLVDLYLFAR